MVHFSENKEGHGLPPWPFHNCEGRSQTRAPDSESRKSAFCTTPNGTLEVGSAFLTSENAVENRVEVHQQMSGDRAASGSLGRGN
jgi:hypothetical protein